MFFIFSDGWKAKQCVMRHIEFCSKEEKDHVMERMSEKLKNISDVCQNKDTLDSCALEFKDIVQKFLGLKLDLDWEMKEGILLLRAVLLLVVWMVHRQLSYDD